MYRGQASLEDSYRAGQNCLSFAKNLTQSALKSDEVRLSAIAYQILIIGEATTRLSDGIRESHLEVP